jgi:hypothetical protein
MILRLSFQLWVWAFTWTRTEKLSTLKWKTWPKQLLGSLPLAYALPTWPSSHMAVSKFVRIGWRAATDVYLSLRGLADISCLWVQCWRHNIRRNDTQQNDTHRMEYIFGLYTNLILCSTVNKHCHQHNNEQWYFFLLSIILLIVILTNVMVLQC